MKTDAPPNTSPARRARPRPPARNPELLPDYVHEGVLADELGCSRRALARARQDGLAYARIAGKVFIHVPSARTYYANRTVGLKPKRGR